MALKQNNRWLRDRGNYFHDQINRAIVRRATLIDRIVELRDMYNKESGGFVSADNKPWEGAVDIHLPVLQEKVETAVPKIVAAIWRANPFVTVRNNGGPGAEAAAKNMERFLSWAFKNDIEGAYEILVGHVRDMLLDGTSILKITWKRKWRRAIEDHVLLKRYTPGELGIDGEPVELAREKTDLELLVEVFGFGSTEKSLLGQEKLGQRKYSVSFLEAGKTMSGQAEIKDDPENGNKMIVRVHRDVLMHDSPRFDNVSLEDFVVPWRTQDINNAKWVAHKTWYSLAEIEQLRSDGDWRLTRRELDFLKGKRVDGDRDSALAEQADNVIGDVGPSDGEADTTSDGVIDPNRIPVWEIYCKDAADDIGGTIDVVYTMPEDLRKITAIRYHDDLFPHGKRPFIVSKYISLTNRFYGIGMGEQLYGINEEVDHTMSYVHNMTELVSNPWFLYSPYAVTGNDKLLDGIAPGQGIPVADPSGVSFPKFGQEPLQMYHASFNTLLNYGDRLTSSPQLGGNTQRNAPRTARGTLALMEQAEEKLSSVVEAMQAGPWKEMVKQVVSLYGRYISSDKWYSVTGEDSPRRISPSELRNNFLYEFEGSLTNVNRDVKRALATQRYTTARTDPLYQSDPRAQQALLADYLTYMSEGTDVRGMIPALPGEGGYSHPPMDQGTENRALAAGVHVDVLPSDDDQKHIDAIDAFMRTDEYERLPFNSVAQIAAHKNAHLSALQRKALASQRATEAGLTAGMPNGRPEPGAPVEGIPGMGGEMSFMEGGQQ